MEVRLFSTAPVPAENRGFWLAAPVLDLEQGSGHLPLRAISAHGSQFSTNSQRRLSVSIDASLPMRDRSGAPLDDPSGRPEHPERRLPARPAPRGRGPEPGSPPRACRRWNRPGPDPAKSSRSGAESNRCRGFCRPLPDHSATGPREGVISAASRARSSGRLAPGRRGTYKAASNAKGGRTWISPRRAG